MVAGSNPVAPTTELPRTYDEGPGQSCICGEAQGGWPSDGKGHKVTASDSFQGNSGHKGGTSSKAWASRGQGMSYVEGRGRTDRSLAMAMGARNTTTKSTVRYWAFPQLLTAQEHVKLPRAASPDVVVTCVSLPARSCHLLSLPFLPRSALSARAFRVRSGNKTETPRGVRRRILSAGVVQNPLPIWGLQTRGNWRLIG